MFQAAQFTSKGNAAFVANKFDEAIKFYSNAIEIDGKNHLLYSYRSATYEKIGKYDLALEDAEQAIELQPDWLEGYTRKGYVLERLGRHEEAAKVYKDGFIRDRFKDPFKGLRAQDILSRKREDINRTFKDPTLLTRLRTDPKTKEYLNDPEYLKLIEELQTNPSAFKMKDPRVLSTLEVIFRSSSHVKRIMSVDLFKPSTSKKSAMDHNLPPEKKKALKEKSLGNEAYNKKDFETALKHYNKAKELDPADIIYYNNIAAVYFEQKEYNKCIKECEKGIKIGKENRADMNLIAKAYTRMDKAMREKRWNDPNKTKTDNMVDFRVFETFNLNLQEKEPLRLDHAKPSTSKKTTSLPKIPAKGSVQDSNFSNEKMEAHKENTLGNEAYNEKDFETALKHYNKAKELDPTDIIYYNNMAAVYFEQKEFKKCIEECEKGIKVGKENRADSTLTAKAFERMNKAMRKKNLNHQNSTQKDSIADPRVLETFNIKLQETEPMQFDLAKPSTSKKTASLSKLPAKESVDSNFSNEKKEALREKSLGNEAYNKRDFETALKHYSKAKELDPTDIIYYNNLAAVYFEQKKYRKCIEECENGIKVGMENKADLKLIAKAFARIGNAHKKLNDLTNAKTFYEKSLSEHQTPEIRILCSVVEKMIKDQEEIGNKRWYLVIPNDNVTDSTSASMEYEEDVYPGFVMDQRINPSTGQIDRFPLGTPLKLRRPRNQPPRILILVPTKK